jgi:hypothetical protein
LTLFLKVLEKQQEMAISAGLIAQKVGNGTTQRVRVHSQAGEAADEGSGDPPALDNYLFLFIF